jgi:two-component SAPR family response regulator
MLKAIVVDDQRIHLEIMKILLEKNHNIDIVGMFHNGKDAMVQILIDSPDVVFLDIEMPEMNGIELAREIEKIDEDIQIVFVSAYEKYAMEAFKVNATNYILKPVMDEEINKTIDRILKRRNFAKDKLNPAKQLKILCLGDFKVCGEIVIRWPTAKVAELFAYFICHANKRIDKWELCDVLWQDMQPEKAEHNLHSAIHRLKSTLKNAGFENILHYEKGMYTAALGGCDCDLIRFQSFIKGREILLDNEIDEAENILKLYQGRLFKSQNYIWCNELCEEIDRKYIKLLKLVVRKYVDSGYYTHAEELLKKALEVDSLEESVYELLMTIYSSMGERIKLINQYEQMKQRLLNELGLEPKTSTKKLFKRLLDAF